MCEPQDERVSAYRSHAPRTGPAMVLVLAVLLGIPFTTTACESSRMQTYYGPEVQVGEGHARTYLVMQKTMPTEIGIAFNDSAMVGLPEELDEYEYVLPLPKEAGDSPYRDVVLDWNPRGHPPEGVYTVPHFDFHFYTINDAERLKIVPSDSAFGRKAAHQPPADQVPAGYIVAPLPAVPEMGVHWVDPQAPELNGKPFTHTFIFGSWDGRITFYEPMVSLAFLQTRPETTAQVPMAERHDQESYYPTEYRVTYDAGTHEYRVGLAGLILHR